MVRPVFWLGILCAAIILGVFAHYAFGWNPFDTSKSKAREAIEVAATACSVGNRIVFSEKLVDAKVAIQRVHGFESLELEAVLNNRLKQLGCSSD